MATFDSDKAVISCVNAVGLVRFNDTNYGNLLAVADIASESPIVSINFEDINFEGADVQEVLEAVLSAGNNNLVEVRINNCTMVRQTAWASDTTSLPLGARYNIFMESSDLLDNQVVLNPVFGSGAPLEFSIQLSGSRVVGNQLMALPLGMVTGRANSTLSLLDSEVHSNQVMSLGAFAGSEAGSLRALLEGSVASNNMVTGVGLLALGGAAEYEARVQSGSEVLGNKLAGMGLFVENQALVRATVQLIARLSFNDPSLNLTQILDNLQQEFCKVFPDDYEDMEQLGLLGDLMDGLRTVVCGDGSTPPPSLGTVADLIGQFLDNINNTAGASLDNLLARLQDLPSLLPQALTLLPLLQNLSLDTLLSPQTLQPILNFIQQLMAPLPGGQ